MSESDISAVVRDALMTVMLVSSPVLVIGLVVGLVVSVFQATTQINEQSLGFVPKIVAVFAAIIAFGPWMLTKLMDFTTRLYQFINASMG